MNEERQSLAGRLARELTPFEIDAVAGANVPDLTYPPMAPVMSDPHNR